MSQRMSTLDRTKLAWSIFRGRGVGPPMRMQRKAAPYRWPAWRKGQPQWHLTDFYTYVEEGFNENALLYSAIMYKVRAGTTAPLAAYQGDPTKPEPLDPKAPLSRLVKRPNPHQSWMEFQGANIVYLNVSGNVYIYIDRERKAEEKAPKKGKTPTALWSLRPDRVYILPDDERGVKGYLYAPEGADQTSWVPILPDNMIHVKLPNPGDPLEGMGYGLSPISPIARSADVDNAVTKFLKIFFDQGTMVSGLLKFHDRLDDDDVNRARERWRELYGGYQNWADVGVLDEGGEFERISMTFEEMGFETLDERNESRVLGPLGVPPILIGSRIGLARSTYSNYELARRAFWEDTMVPELKLFETEYAHRLAEEGSDAWVAYDLSDVPALRKNMPEIVASWQAMVELGVPKAEAAEIVGLPLPKLPDGDVSYMPTTLVPVKADGQPVAPPAPPALPPGREEGGGEEEAEDEDEDEDSEQKGGPARGAGPGSGHHGHRGRQGQRGGSVPGGVLMHLPAKARRQTRIAIDESQGHTLETGNEAGICIMADGTKVNGTQLGSETSVAMTHLTADRNAAKPVDPPVHILVHSHPTASAPSPADLFVNLRDGIEHGIVVDTTGTVYRYSRTDKTLEDRNVHMGTYKVLVEARNTWAKAFKTTPESRGLSGERYLYELSHYVMQGVTREANLYYERIPPQGGVQPSPPEGVLQEIGGLAEGRPA